MKVYFHKHEHSPRWYYLAIGKWQPFKVLNHGGWFMLSPRWFWRFAFTEPKRRGWRWG